MMNIDPMSFNQDGTNSAADNIRKIDMNFSIETPDMIIGAVLINSIRSPEDTVVAKIFIYKYTSPAFIEVSFDETYIAYLFDDPVSASTEIANYTLRMLTIDFPGSILNMEASSDIGLIRLPQTVNR